MFSIKHQVWESSIFGPRVCIYIYICIYYYFHLCISLYVCACLYVYHRLVFLGDEQIKHLDNMFCGEWF